MEDLGGVVIRRTRREFLDAEINRDVAAMDADLTRLEANQ